MIVYGWNSYVLKSVSLMDLGIISNEQTDSKIEYRQKYFHLFFIPCIPIGRMWAVKQAGKLYEVNPDILSRLEQVETRNKNWIWAWTGPLLGIAIWIIASISSNIEEKAYQTRMEQGKAVLSTFFKDKSKTSSLQQKLQSMNTMIDSSLSSVLYEEKEIDTSEDALVLLYLQIAATQMDSLTGYDKNNTLVVTAFHKRGGHSEVINSDCQSSLEAGEWKGYYSDTASVFAELHKLEKYKYILVLKEYSRLDPVTEGSGYMSGYSLVKGKLLSIETGKQIKDFSLMAANSDEVKYYSASKSSPSSAELRRNLESDLDKNVMKEANKYVFGEEVSY